MIETVDVVSRAATTTVDFTVTAAYSGNGASVDYSTASVAAKVYNLTSADDVWFKVDSGSWQLLKARLTEEFAINFATQTLTMKLGEHTDGSASIRLVAKGVPSGLYAGETEIAGAALAALGVYAHLPVATKTDDYIATVADRAIDIDCTSNDVTITLPAASASGAGFSQMLEFKRVDSSEFTATIARAGADTIDGATSTTLLALEAKNLRSNGVSKWRIV